MTNDFDAGWSSSFEGQEIALAEPVVIGDYATTAIVVEFAAAEVVGQAGGRDRDLTVQIEVSRAKWSAAHGRAGIPVKLRGIWLKVADEPSDSPDCGSVLLTLVPPHR